MPDAGGNTDSMNRKQSKRTGIRTENNRKARPSARSGRRDDEMDELKQKLEKYGQSHLYEGFKGLDADAAEAYRKTLESIDYELVSRLYRAASGNAENTQEEAEGDSVYSPMPVTDSAKLCPEIREQYIKRGSEIIR